MADVIDTNTGYIIPGLRADIMRKAMETKDLLKTKGSIYVGLGNDSKDTVEGYDLYKTDVLERPSSEVDGRILCCDGDNANTKGLVWRTISKTPDKLDSNPKEINLLDTITTNNTDGIQLSFFCVQVEEW